MSDDLGIGAGPGINGSPTGPSFRRNSDPNGRPSGAWTIAVVAIAIVTAMIIIVW